MRRAKNSAPNHRYWLTLHDLHKSSEPQAAYDIWKRLTRDSPTCQSMNQSHANKILLNLKEAGFVRMEGTAPAASKGTDRVLYGKNDEERSAILEALSKRSYHYAKARMWTDNDTAKFCEFAEVTEHFAGLDAAKRLVRLRQTAIEELSLSAPHGDNRPWMRRARDALRQLAALELKLLEAWQSELYQEGAERGGKP